MRFFCIISLTLLVLPLTAAGQERAVYHQVIVSAPIDSVWTAWTTTEGVQSFFAPSANIGLRVDGPYEIFFNPYGEQGLRGADGMRILAFQDQRMLAFTWNAPPSLPEARKQRTHVIVRFHPQSSSSTKVTLYHDGWGEGGEWDAAFTYFDGAWPKVLANLQKRFASGPIDWAPFLEQLRKSER